MAKYEMGCEGLPSNHPRYEIKGKLHKTDRTVRVVGCGGRRIYADEKGGLFVKCFNKWWKFPQEIDY